MLCNIDDEKTFFWICCKTYSNILAQAHEALMVNPDHSDQLDHPVKADPEVQMANLVLLEPKDHVVQMAKQAVQVNVVQLDQLVQPDQPENPEKGDQLEMQEHEERLEKQAQVDQPDRLDLLVNVDHKDPREREVQLDLLDLQVSRC